MNADAKLRNEFGFGQDIKTAVIVVVPQSIRIMSEALQLKSLKYKSLSSESSCRKYLDSIARCLNEDFFFETKFKHATIGDVFKAIKNNQWACIHCFYKPRVFRKGQKPLMIDRKSPNVQNIVFHRKNCDFKKILEQSSLKKIGNG